MSTEKMVSKGYSQLGQDLWVLEKFPINNGYFVDIGFGDGVHINNTYLLELNGWNGIGVDPIATNYQDRINTTIYKEVVYSESNIELNFVKHKEFSGFVDTIYCHKHILTDNKSEFIKLKTTTLLEILQLAKAPNFIHYMSLDTEGSEYEILKTFPFQKYSFGCITIEHNYIQNQRQNIKELLEANGYIFDKQLKWDDCYIKSGI